MRPSDVALRSADVSDADAIHGLLAQLASWVGSPDGYRGTPQTLVQFGFGDMPHFHLLVAERSHGGIVGACVYFREFSTWRSQPGVFVQDIVIDEHHRGGGLGRRLLDATFVDAQARWAATYLRLAVDKDNTTAIRFYERLGFERRDDTYEMVLEASDRRTM